MKVSAAAFSLLALAGSSSAQYFSAGWQPGQKAQDATVAAPSATATFVPKATETATAKSSPFSFRDLLDINKLLMSEPAVALFSTFGVNITDRVQTAVKIWDERIPLITDDNFNDLIVNETLTEEEEDKRVWILVISVTAAKQVGISKFLDNTFDAAFNETQLAGDLPNVRWGRIDYLNVTAITTKWALWQAPYLVVLKDRGKTLRFYRPHEIRLRDDALREFLKVDGWKQTKPWSTAYAPGGSREFIMDFQAKWFTFIYNWVTIVPKWALLFLSGSIASVVIGILHGRPSKKTAAAPNPATKPTVTTPPSAAIKAATPSNATDSEHESSSSARRTSARQRKNKK